MDKIDLQIIRELMQDARKSFRKIANIIGISTQTVIMRYNKMCAKGIIEMCTITIDAEKIGYKGTAYILIQHSSESSLSEMVEDLGNIQNVIVAAKAIGDFEGYAILLFRDIKDLYEKVAQIKCLSSVFKVEVSFAIPGMRHVISAHPFQVDKIIVQNKQFKDE